MTSAPASAEGTPVGSRVIDWNDYASLHRKEHDHGVLFQFTALRSGTLAEMVHFVLLLPEAEQRDYVIQKAGDHLLDAHEIQMLARRPDFPA